MSAGVGGGAGDGFEVGEEFGFDVLRGSVGSEFEGDGGADGAFGGKDDGGAGHGDDGGGGAGVFDVGDEFEVFVFLDELDDLDHFVDVAAAGIDVEDDVSGVEGAGLFEGLGEPLGFDGGADFAFDGDAAEGGFGLGVAFEIGDVFAGDFACG